MATTDPGGGIDGRAATVLDDLDAIARAFDDYGCGLPRFAAVREKMAGVVAAAIREAVTGERAACAEVCDNYLDGRGRHPCTGAADLIRARGNS